MTGRQGEPAMDAELTMFEDTVRRFIEDHAPPARLAEWRENGIVDRTAWEAAGRAGILLPSIPFEYGGGGGDFRFEATVIRQLGLVGAEGWGMPLHSAIVAPYILHYGTEEQKQRLLPKLATAELIGAIAMTEPGTGSDLRAIKTRAIREADGWRINGAKTFITNGQLADLILIVARTGEPNDRGGGLSLFAAEVKDLAGFRRGRALDKIGIDAGDTSELFFDDMLVPFDSLLGAEGAGMVQLMQQLPQERLIIAYECVALMERALNETLNYVSQRRAFGKAVIEFQNTQFKLAEAKTSLTVGQAFVEHCTKLLLDDNLDAATASMAKMWTSERACEVVSECLQLHGGYGYMNEYPIAQMYRDVRVKTIYGGTNEIMKVLIARSL
jgi:acyl-CoA dehydrogenase